MLWTKCEQYCQCGPLVNSQLVSPFSQTHRHTVCILWEKKNGTERKYFLICLLEKSNQWGDFDKEYTHTLYIYYIYIMCVCVCVHIEMALTNCMDFIPGSSESEMLGVLQDLLFLSLDITTFFFLGNKVMPRINVVHLDDKKIWFCKQVYCITISH